MKPTININTGNVSYREFKLFPKMNIFNQNLPLQKESVNNNVTEYILQTNDEYLIYFFVENGQICSILIEYIGFSKNWDEYISIENIREQKVKEILLENNIKDEGKFRWGSIKYVYDPKNTSYFVSVHYL